MERRIVRAQELDFDTPGRRDYFVALEHDSIWGDHLIPMTVFVGPQAKPARVWSPSAAITGTNTRARSCCIICSARSTSPT